MRFCKREDIALAKAEAYGLDEHTRKVPRVEIWATHIPSAIIDLVPESVVRQNVVLPLEDHADRLVVAIADDSDIETIEKLRFILNNRIETRLAWADDIRRAIDHYYGRHDDWP